MYRNYSQSHTLLFDEHLSYTHLIPYLLVHSLIAVSNISINSFLLHALNRLKRTSTVSFLFVKFLCASDISVGISQVLYLVCRSLIRFYSSDMASALDFTMQTIFYIASPFSGGMILVIAADRYMHMKYLTKYSAIMTRGRALILVFMNFVFQLTTAVSLLFASLNGYFAIQQPVLVCVYLTMIGAAVLLYQEAFRSIRRRTRNSSVGMETLAKTATIERRSPSYDFSRTMMHILMSLVICYLPFLSLTTIRSVIILYQAEVPFSFMYALLWTYNLNFLLSTVNPVIFITFNKDLRSYAKKKIYREGSQRRRSSQWEEFPMVKMEANLTETTVRRLTVASLPW